MDVSWSEWSARTEAEYAGILPATYRMSVRARDAAGNVSAAETRALTIP